MTSWEFPADGPIEARISLPAGSVTLTAAPTETVTVSLTPTHTLTGAKDAERLIGETEVSFEGGRLSVEVPKRLHIRGNASLDLTIALPGGSTVDANIASADLRGTVELAGLRVHAASGDVTVEKITGQADLTTASGDVRLEWVTGDIRIKTASGDVNVGSAEGDIKTTTASGDVRIGQARQWVQSKTASGDIRIDAIAEGRAEATSVSGDISVAVPPGTDVYLDLSSLSGRVRSDLDAAGSGQPGGEPGLALTCNTVSGDIRVSRGGDSIRVGRGGETEPR